MIADGNFLQNSEKTDRYSVKASKVLWPMLALRSGNTTEQGGIGAQFKGRDFCHLTI
jgi:hypothetical protein